MTKKELPSHTPGPWRWRNDALQGKQISLHPGILIADGKDGTPWGDWMDQANARLIAASPDMHSALDRLLVSYKQLLAQKPVRDATETIAEAEAALKKARGDAQEEI